MKRLALLTVALMGMASCADTPGKVNEKLSELEKERLLKTQAQRTALDLQHTNALQPIIAEQNVVIKQICARLGVPAEKIAECAIDLDAGLATWQKPASDAKSKENAKTKEKNP